MPKVLDHRGMPVLVSGLVGILLLGAGCRAPQPALQQIEVLVLLPDGSPATETRLHGGGRSRWPMTPGQFWWQLPTAPGQRWIITKPGYEPLVIDDPRQLQPAADGVVELRLQPSPSIRGRIESELGWSVGYQVMLLDTTPCDGDHEQRPAAEDFAAGFAAVPKFLGNDFAPPERLPSRVDCGAEGIFELRGLRAGRHYRLQLWNARTHEVATSAPVLAGTQDFVWRLPASNMRPVTGRLRDRSGAAVAGVEVWAEVPLQPGEAEVDRFVTARVRSDRDGAFAFVRLPRRPLRLHASSPSWSDPELVLAADGASPESVVLLDRRCRLAVGFDGAGPRPDAMRVLDPDDAVLPAEIERPERAVERGRELPLVRGGAEIGGFVAFVSERASVLVLLRDGAEWRRVPLVWGADGELSLRL
jgi:hypothetical protein